MFVPYAFCSTTPVLCHTRGNLKQGHHHNGDQVARQPRSICGRRFTTPLFGVRVDRDELIRLLAHVFPLANYRHKVYL